MALQVGISGLNPIIPLISKWNEDDITYVTGKNLVTVNGDQEEREAELSKMVSTNPEDIIRCINEFLDNIGGQGLGIKANGAKLYNCFRKTLSLKNSRTSGISVEPETPTLLLVFATILQRSFVEPTDLADQRRYLEILKKPDHMSYQSLSNRLRFINTKLLNRFPGSNNLPPYNDNDLKRVYLQMVEPFQNIFTVNGGDIDALDYDEL
ncbi:MAG: hypothetical protein SGILL_009551, partial [Bacillariaceae sp.]